MGREMLEEVNAGEGNVTKRKAAYCFLNMKQFLCCVPNWKERCVTGVTATIEAYAEESRTPAGDLREDLEAMLALLLPPFWGGGLRESSLLRCLRPRLVLRVVEWWVS